MQVSPHTHTHPNICFPGGPSRGEHGLPWGRAQALARLSGPARDSPGTHLPIPGCRMEDPCRKEKAAPASPFGMSHCPARGTQSCCSSLHSRWPWGSVRQMANTPQIPPGSVRWITNAPSTCALTGSPCTHACAHTHTFYVHVRTHMHTCSHNYASMHSHTCTHVHTYVHAPMHIHTCTLAHTGLRDRCCGAAQPPPAPGRESNQKPELCLPNT